MLGGLSLLLVFAAIPLELASPGTLSVNGSSDVMSDGAGVVFVLAFTAVGVLVARRQPHNPMGWLLLGAGLVWEVGTYYCFVSWLKGPLSSWRTVSVSMGIVRGGW